MVDIFNTAIVMIPKSKRKPSMLRDTIECDVGTRKLSNKIKVQGWQSETGSKGSPEFSVKINIIGSVRGYPLR